MSKFNFDNKRFALIQNSASGQVSSEIVFEYKENGNLVIADYYGRTIKYRIIIAYMKDDEFNMLYHCLTTDHQLKAGNAMAKISFSDNGKIKLNLNWEWLTHEKDKRISEYIEI